MTSAWRVPETYRTHLRGWDGRQRWLSTLGRTAAECAKAWAVTPDGPPMHGWTSMVWPVTDVDGRPFVLKVSPPWPDTAGEAAALTTWAQRRREPHRMIVPERVDLDRRTMLLPRLDHARSLEDHPDIDEAVMIIAEVLASISGIAAPAGIPRVADQLVEIEDRLDQSTGMIPHLIDRARARLAELSTWLSGPNASQSLLHNDCHFLNVLRDPREGEPEWTGIDPLPVAGPPEWELIPLLRNRWAAAVATGRPERALLRRVDVVSEIVGLDRDLVRTCAQIAAVFNLVGPLDPDHLHYPPYAVMATW